MADKTIYERLADARKQFHELELKKSGKNTFAKYSYFELGDFVIPGMDCLRDNGLIPVVNFDREYATMTIHDYAGNTIIINSPMAEAHLKGCHPIQNLGAVQTYQRRYLWMAALEIVEHDALDASKPLADEPPVAKESKPALADATQKALLTDFQEAGHMPARRVVWCKNNWDRMTFTQAKTIIDECRQMEREAV